MCSIIHNTLYASSQAHTHECNEHIDHSQSETTISPHATEQGQAVNRKRHRKTEDHEYPTAKKTDYWLGEAVPTNNRFSSLAEEIPMDEHTQLTDPKPPPIFISGVTNIKPLIELLNELAPNKYFVKTLSHDQVKVQPTESSVHTVIIKALMDRNTEFHTYKPRQDRSFRVVLKSLHPSTEVNDIKQALQEEGHEVTNVWNVKQRNTNKPLPIHFVDIKPHTTNKDIYKLTTLLHTVVKVETPHIKRNIPQCMRCQKYGHTKNYCRCTSRCVKCAQQHLTSECPGKNPDENVKCANCNEPHPANYRGCIIHKQLQQKLYPTLRVRQTLQTSTPTDQTRPVQAGISYAEVTQGQHSRPQPNAATTRTISMEQPSNDLGELKQMMTDLINQMDTLLNLISALVSKTN